MDFFLSSIWGRPFFNTHQQLAHVFFKKQLVHVYVACQA
jgi:hypothetical protein